MQPGVCSCNSEGGKMSWSLRVRGGSGQAVLSSLLPGTPLTELQELIAEKLGIPAQQQELLAGFPPQSIQVGTDPSATIASVGIVNGDSLTVRQRAVPAAASPASPAAPPAAGAGAAAAAQPCNGDPYALDDADEDAQLAAAIAASIQDSQQPAPAAAAPAAAPTSGNNGSKPPGGGQTPAGKGPAPTSVQLADGSCVVRRIIPSDNSCLFTAVGYVMEHDRTKAQELRKVIADTVAADPVTYNDGFLGKANEEYCAWITDKKNWGGAIELSILSAHYKRGIDAYDIQTKRCDRYGEQEGYEDRVMLIYDGLHYDALAVAAFDGAPEDLDITVLQVGSPDADAAAAGGEQLVAACHEARQFTDVANFTLRCGICQIGIKGEKEAVEHAKATGHTNFAEY